MNENKPWDAILAHKLVYNLRDSWITPNYITSIRLLFGVLSAVLFSIGDNLLSNLAAICFLVSNFLDHADGELARITGKMSKVGHIYDLACDAIVNIALFIGIGIGLAKSGLGIQGVFMGIIAGLSVALIFHLRYFIEKKVGKETARQPNMNVIEAEDVLYLLPLITLMEWLQSFLTLAVIGAPLFATFTVYQYIKVVKE